MGAIEALILFIYAVTSTVGNVYQSNINGQLKSEVVRYKSIAVLCTHNGQKERRSVILEANNRASTEQQNENSFAEYRQGVSMALQADSGTCINVSAGDLPGSLVDAEGRLMEELREHRVQPEPVVILPTFHSGASED